MTTIPEPNVNPAAMPWARALTKAVRDSLAETGQIRSSVATAQQAISVVAAQTVTQQRDLSGINTELTPTLPPLTPTAPTLTTILGTISIVWDGKFTEDEGHVPGFSHVNAQVSLNGTSGWAMTGQPLTGAGQEAVITGPVGETRHVRLIAVNNAGMVGTPSASRSIVIQGVAAPDIDGAIMDAINQATADSAEAIELAVVAEALASTAEVEAQAAQSAAGNALSVANTAQTAANGAATAAANAAGIAGAKADVIYSSTAPAADKRLPTTLWIDTANNANTPKRWNSTSNTWVAVTDKAATDAAAAAATAKATADAAAADASAAAIAAGNALTTANGKNKIWHQASQPPLTGNVTGDLWWDSDDGNRMYEWSGAAWVANQFGTNALSDTAITAAKLADKAVSSAKLADKAVGTTQLADAVNTSITTAQSTASNAATVAANAATAASTAQSAASAAQSDADAAAATAASAAGIAGAKGEVIFGSTAPAAAKQLAQNLWIDTTGNANTPKRWNGNAWAAVTDKAATDAAAAAVTAKSAADAAQGTANTATTLANAAKTAADGAASAASAAASAASSAQTTADGKSKVMRETTAASNPANYSKGDQWWQINSSNDVVALWIHSGSAWVQQKIGAGAIGTDAIGTTQLATSINNAITTAQSTATNAASAASAAQGTANTALTTANGKNKIVRSTSDASTPANYDAGDQWWKYSGTQIVGMWLHTGSAWQAQTLTDSVITNLSAATITAGTLAADRIGANTISTKKLLVGDFTNLIEDEDFDAEIGMTWARRSGPTSASNFAVTTGLPGKSWKLDGVSTEVSVQSVNLFPVDPGVKYRFNARAQNNLNAPGYIRIYWYKEDGTTLASQNYSNLTVNVTSWTDLTMEVTSPADAFFGRMQIIHAAIATSGSWWIGRMSLRRMNDASLIVDGAIVADKIATNAIVADKIAANAITTAKIATNAVTANEIAANSITATNGIVASLDAGKITVGSLSGDRIAANTITGTHIAGATVTAANMVAGTITAASGIIADAAISRAKIQNLAVDTAQIADLAVETGKINSLAVTDAKIAALAVTEAKIANLAVTNGKIANLAVNNAKIADATIEHGKIATLDANKITVGTLNAQRIGANSIGTNKLLVTSFENLVLDSSFEYVTGGAWTTTHANTTVVTGNARTGSYAMRIATTTASFEASRQTQSFFVEPGDQYRISAWVRLDSGTSASNGIALRFGYSATETGTVTASGDIAVTPNGTGTTYVNITGVWTVPTAARFAHPQIVMRDVASGKVYRVDDVEVYKMASAEVIVDGAITTVKLAADAVTADKLAANAVVANSIAAGAIDGKTITGATIRTAASGQRVQLDTSGLRAFNSSNVVTGSLTASAGGLTLSGVLTTGATNAQRVEIDATSVEFFDTAGVRGGTIVGTNVSPGQASTAALRLSSATSSLYIGRINLPYGGSSEASLAGAFQAEELHSTKLYVEGRDIGFDSGWITPTLQNGWSHSITVQYRRVGNLLWLRGRPTGGQSGAIFTLPESYRVPVALAFAAVTGGANPATFARIILQTNGAVEALAGLGDPNLHSIGPVPLD